MADSNFSNAAEQNELAQDDPFAELTRIMGHDPRSVPRPRPVDEEPADSLALELENELMGDLADEGEPSGEADEAPYWRQEAAWQQEPAPTALQDAASYSDDEALETAIEAEMLEAKPDSTAADAPAAGDAQSALADSASGGDEGAAFADALAPSDEEFAFDDAVAPTEEEASLEDVLSEGDEHHREPVDFGWDAAAEDAFTIRDEDLAALDSDFAAPDFDVEAEPLAPPEVQNELEAYGDSAENESQAFDDQADAEAEPSYDVREEPDSNQEDVDAIAEGEADAPFDYAQAIAARPSIFSAADAADPVYAQAPVPEQAWDAGAAEAWNHEATPADEHPVSSAVPDALEDWSPETIFAADNGAHGAWQQVLPESGEDSAQSDLRYMESLPPEIDTVDVPEGAVAPTDNLDIPEVSYREEVKPAAELDEIEEMLAGAFGDMEETSDQSDDAWMETAPRPVETPQVPEDKEFDDYLTAGLGAGMAAFSSQQADARYADDVIGTYGDSPSRDWNVGSAQPLAPSPGAEPPVESGKRLLGSRALMAAAVVGGVAILGGVTVFALSFGDDDPAEPVLVKADNTPVKVKPENPGGTAIPNQDNQVYRRVSGDEAEQMAQKQLVSTTEEPVDLPARDARAAGGETVKRDDRLENPVEQSASDSETASLAPRRVRSFVVRPDGTMVQREVPEPDQTAETATARSAAEQLTAAAVEPIGSGDAASPTEAGAMSAPGQTQGQPRAATAPEEGAADTSAAAIPVPRSAPIPPSRPANVAATQQQANAPTASANRQAPAAQPSGSAPTQVAAATPQPAQSAASGWSVQIASQPTVEGAQQSYQQLAQRYGNMLQGKGVNIVKADIADKGTYYRVRIPSSSKDEAIRLCEQLKSAGGSCFVSK